MTQTQDQTQDQMQDQMQGETQEKLQDVRTSSTMSRLIALGDQLFTGPVSDAVLTNHASYVRDSSASTINDFSAFLERRSLVIFWLCAASKGFLSVMRVGFLRRQRIVGDDSHSRILFVSHLTNLAQLDQGADPYFGDMPKVAAAQLGATSTLRINHRRADIKGAIHRPGELVESGYFDLGGGLRAFMRNLTASIGLLVRSCKERDPDFRTYLRFLAATQMDHRTLAAARIVERLVQAVKMVNAEVVFITFEGYAWERAAIAAMHKIVPQVRVLGYQHAILTGSQRAINKRFGPKIDPDHIVTVGTYMTERLVEEGAFPASHFTVIGTQKVTKGETNPLTLGASLLAVPQGIKSEAIMLANCIAKVARALPAVQCILRMHPVLPWDQIRHQVKDWDENAANLLVSSQSLEDDIDQAGWVLYRGSSVAINAMRKGRRTIYFNVDDSAFEGDIVPNDVLWRQVVTRSEEIISLIESDSMTLNKTAKANQEKAAAFAREYYVQPDNAALVTVIKHHLAEGR